MKKAISFIAITVIVLLTLPALSEVIKSTLVISREKNDFSLCQHMTIFEDKSRSLKLEDIQKKYAQKRFRKNTSKTFSFGLTSSTFWINFQVVQKDIDPVKGGDELVFDINPAFPGRIKWQLFEDASGKLVEVGGHKHSKKKTVSLKLSQKHNSFFLKVSSNTGLIFQPRLFRWESYIGKEKLISIFIGIFNGIILVVFLYNLVFGLSLNDLSFLWYCTHLVFTFLYFLGINGLTATYFLSDNPELVGMLNRTFLGMMSVTMALLTRSFLMTRKQAPVMDRLILALALLSFLLSTGNFLLPARMVNTSLSALGMIVPLVTVFTAGRSYKNGFRPALLFMNAWGFFLIGIMFFALTVGGIIPFTSFGFYSFQGGSAVTALLLSIALRDRIHTLKEEHTKFKESMDRVTLILDSIESGIFLIEKESGLIQEINRAAEKIIGKNKENIIGTLCNDFLKYDENCPLYEEGKDKINEAILINGSGKEVPVLLRAKVIELDGHILLLTSFVDITDRKKMEQELKLMATTDPLTGAHNRRSFYEKGEREIIRTRRYDHPLSILMLDVDHFKKINDTYGHSIGDEVLRALTAKILEVIRESDILGRIGGEEFAIILPETPIDCAQTLGERLLKHLSSLEINNEKGVITFTVSIGISGLVNTEDTLENIISHADNALYRAKKSGRNQVVMYADDLESH